MKFCRFEHFEFGERKKMVETHILFVCSFLNSEIDRFLLNFPAFKMISVKRGEKIGSVNKSYCGGNWRAQN